MDMNQFAVGNWLNANAIGASARNYIIQKVAPEEVEEGARPKPVCYFMGEPLGLPLNKTNLAFLIEAFGTESDQWVGKTIEVFTMPVSFGGKMVQGVRMRLPASRPAAQHAEIDYTV